MNTKRLYRVAVGVLLLTFLLIGCGAKNIEVTYDGNRCYASGPTELQKGENQFIFKNLTEDNVSLVVDPIRDGHSYQDVVDWAGESGKDTHPTGRDWPDWLDWGTSTLVAIEKDESTGEELITLDFWVRGGAYHISVVNTSTLLYYPCAPLQVVEGPSG